LAGIVVSAFIPLVIGALWYHPKVFGTAWMQATGITEAKIKAVSPAKAYIVAIILSVILSFYLYINVLVGGPDEMRHGQEAFMGLFVIFPALATNTIFEMKSIKYIFINVLYWIVSLALMGGALNAWPT
jgi:hypothetical protein